MANLRSDPWWKSTAFIVWWIFSRLWAPLMALGLPLLVIYGFVFSTPTDLAPLNLKQHELALLVGIASGEECQSEQPCNRYAQHSYIVIPRVLSNFATVEINEKNGVITVADDNKDAGVLIVVWIICIYGFWYFWIRRFMKRSTAKAA